ncbi:MULTISPECIES: hypothetical protein [unclassified Streptomyces]|uniref:MGH1-like glycoside hydrolase domain-containing protein n=1 Tax=unclassified Streptomyces TaxID=2593676 RepID=UPI003369DC5D
MPARAASDGHGLAWSRDGFSVRLVSEPAPDALEAAEGRLSYDVELAPGASWTAALRCTAAYADGDQFPAAPADAVPWRTPALRSADRRFDQWLDQSVADADRLRLMDPRSDERRVGRTGGVDQFLAAGAPWFLTLFGRDSLWAARMLLPLGTDLAAGTLRTLARRQGAAVDPATEEQPGKILHEGRDGRLADPPIALCEVQAYAYEAARGGAALLRAFGRPGADAWEEWAEGLADRFRTRFWVEDARGPYPAVALDRDGRPVDSVTSGFGHLLGTGLLNREESAALAARLTGPDLDSGHGLRTLSSDSVGFNPYGYHIGSIWPHDTAIAVHGLVRAGFPDAAAPLAAGLLTASAGFDARLPELFAGHGAEAGPRPAPYPASCRPQAWAAASSVQVLRSALGLEADVPGGTVTVAPTFARAYGPLTVTGLQVGGGGWTSRWRRTER